MNPTPPNIEREELRNILTKLCWVVNPAGTEDVEKAMAAIDTYVEQAEARKLNELIGVLGRANSQSEAVIAFDWMWYALPEELRDRATATPHQKEEGGE